MSAPRPFDISECETPQDTARWLLQCSLSDLIREEFFIRRWLRTTGFREGLDYHDAVLSVMRDDRREDGKLKNSMTFDVANGRLWRVAEGIQPVGTGE